MAETIVKSDRGTVKRITLEILYPNGQLKNVVIENSSAELFGTFSMIAMDDHAVNNFLVPNQNILSNKRQEPILDLWNKVEKGGYWRPAILVVNTKGEVVPKCGGHKQLSPPGPKTP